MDYQGSCSPQTSQVSAAPKGISQSIFKMIASLGSTLWTLTWNLNLQDLWQPILAYADFEDGKNERKEKFYFTVEVKIKKFLLTKKF